MEQVHKALEDAIAGQRRVELRYIDDAHYRLFEPYVIHVLTGIHRVVSGVQVFHPVDSDMANTWGCLELAQIRDVREIDEAFMPHRGFSSFAVERYQNVTAAVDRKKVA